MKPARLPTILIALAVLIAGLGAVRWVLYADPRLLRDVSIRPARITPNADGREDVARITYTLTRNARVSISFVGNDGTRYDFRRDQLRSLNRPIALSPAEPYEVLFSGVVNGFRRPDDRFPGEIIARVLPNGDYTWFITATDDAGVTETVSGTLQVRQADTALPELLDFSVYPEVFTPNQDGIDDHAFINYYLTKQVESVQVYLQGPNGERYAIAERQRGVEPGAPGRHDYDYDGGINAGGQPPPDGTYTLVAEAQDRIGQRVRVTKQLTIRDSGVPRADIVATQPDGHSVQWSATSVMISHTLYFTLTVENYGNAPIRTTGPPPGTCYDSDQNFNHFGYAEESGAWRVGIDFDTSLRNYPFRWAVGVQGRDLVQIGKYWYLPPGKRAVVTGCIRIVDVPLRNPLQFWAGLIHEDVEIAELNNFVDPHWITIQTP
ncbi:MAG: hypothetical protein C4311_14420 [Chloroflexota bacterium]